METTKTKLKEYGIKPTPQRVLVYEFMLQNEGKHLSAEYINNNISKDICDFSRATVYNTLNIFSEKGLVKKIKHEKTNELLFDINLKPHIHYICKKCGKLEDLDCNYSCILNALEKSNIPFNKDEDELEICIKGYCRNCKKD